MPLDSPQPRESTDRNGQGHKPEIIAGATRPAAPRLLSVPQLTTRVPAWTQAAKSAFADVRTAAAPYTLRAADFAKAGYAWAVPRLMAQPIWRFCTGTLSRRIFTANFFGLAILLSGFSLLTYQHTWLIDAKAESLRTQARMIAVAIASNAKIDTETMMIDPDRVGDVDRAYPNWRDESLDRMKG